MDITERSTAELLHDLSRIPSLYELNLSHLPPLSHPLVDEARDALLIAINYLPVDERGIVMQACMFGDIAHIKDKRKSGEPYITHPIAVAEIMAGFRMDKDTIIAGILHDTVEDTEVTPEILTDFFGETVTALVDGVTKLKSSHMNKQESQAATFHKILTATLADPRVLLIKLSDRLHNMSTLDAVKPEKQKRTAKETLDFYVPFARIMGLNDIADYIELLCYRNLNPEMYIKFSDKLLQHGLGRQSQKSSIQEYLQKTLNDLNIKGTVHLLDNRTAMFRQFFNNRGNINRLIRQYEFEVVLNDIPSCNRLGFHLINTHQIGDDGIFDHIKKPLPGGNQSLTVIYHENYNQIKVTLQTEQMQKASRLGVIGNNNDISQSVIQASLRNMQDLLSDDLEQNTVAVIDELMSYLHARKIVCYSPQGRAYELPRGATALDFAYAVGPSIGNMATGANINGQKGKLGQVLVAGDTVEIETDPHASIQPNWLGFIATNKARKEILKGLKCLSDDVKITHGKNALEWSLKAYNKTLAEISDTDWSDILSWRGVTNQDELYLQIADGDLLPQLVVSRLFSDVVDNSEEEAITKTQHLLAGVKGVEVEFSRCCNPIYGDPIVGHLSKGGLMVHRHKCHSLIAIRQQNPYQIIQLNWKPDSPNNHSVLRFPANLGISIALSDEQISQVIFEMKTLNIGVESTSDKFIQGKHGDIATTLQLVVRSRSHLLEGIEKLRSILGYPNITRLYQPIQVIG